MYCFVNTVLMLFPHSLKILKAGLRDLFFCAVAYAGWRTVGTAAAAGWFAVFFVWNKTADGKSHDYQQNQTDDDRTDIWNKEVQHNKLPPYKLLVEPN